MCFQHLLHRFNLQRSQSQDLTTRDDGRKKRFGCIGSQKQDGVRGRFFERFEQGVSCAGMSVLEVQKERHPIFGLVRFKRERVLDGAHLLHFESPAFSLGLDHDHVRMLHSGGLFAIAALAAELTGRGRVGAVQRLGES